MATFNEPTKPMTTRKRRSVTFANKSSSKRRKHAGDVVKTSRDEYSAQQEDGFINKMHARPINDQYVLDRKLGQGGFGVVFLGRDITTGEEVALKLEHRSVEPSILEDEAEKCKALQGSIGFPEIYWYGWHDDYKIMAFELLGPSLEDLFAFCGDRFSINTASMLVDQLLHRLECLHSRGVLHRDIKPQNCLMGRGRNGNVVYVTDFGLAENVGPNDDSLGAGLSGSRLIGTARYASIKGHEGGTQSFKDDLESLGYNIIYFLKGKLPWQGLKGRQKDKEALVMEKKKSIKIGNLCARLPRGVAEYMRYVRQLKHGEMPDYQRLRKLFRQNTGSGNSDSDNVFDWTVLLFLAQECETKRAVQQQK